MYQIFEELTLSPTRSVSVQVVQYIKQNILSGKLQHGQELPSRRKLAVLLGINPNTAQKLYKQLEEEDLIETVQGSKSLIKVSPKKLAQLQAELVEEQLTTTLNNLKQSGVSFKQVIDMVTKLWED